MPFYEGVIFIMKVKTKFYLALIIFSLTGQIAWTVENMYFNVFIYKMFNASAGEISAMVMASAVAATVTTLLIGALSDKVGKRKVFMCAGYILWGLSIFAFTLLREDIISVVFPMAASASAIGVSLTIIFDCIMTFFGSSANDACFNAWLTDMTDHSDRGKAEGINSMMPLVAILAVFGGFMGFDLNLPSSWSVIFAVIGIVVIGIGISGIWLIDDPEISTDGNQNYFANIIYGFRPSVIGEHKQLYLYFIAVAIFGISIQVFMPYLIIYYTVTLEMTNYVFVMAPAIILASVFTAWWGGMFDHHGFGFSMTIPLVMLGLGYGIMSFAVNTLPVFIGSLLMMCGYLSGATVLGAVIRDNTPANRSGMFQGLRIVSQVLIPGVVGPAISAYLLRSAETVTNDDGTLSFIPDPVIFEAAFAVAVGLATYLYLIFRNGKAGTK